MIKTERTTAVSRHHRLPGAGTAAGTGCVAIPALRNWSSWAMVTRRHTERMEQPWPSAKYFDGWYADMAGSAVKDEIMQRHLGLPPHLLSTSLLGWEGIAEVVEALRLSPGDILLDLACGRGGYGLEIAARSRARLVGGLVRRVIATATAPLAAQPIQPMR